MTTISNAATYNIADGDVGGLIAAINASNANVDPDTINLAHNGTYMLTYVAGPDSWHGPTGLPIVQGNSTQRASLTINGNGSTITRSEAPGTPEFRVLYTLYANVVLDSLVIKNGRIQGLGGGLYLNVSDTVLRNSTITENWANDGGGICNINGSTLTIENSTISHNTGYGGRTGGGLLNFAAGPVSISHSTFYENQADGPPGFQGRGDAIVDSSQDAISIKNSIVASPTRGIGNDCMWFTLKSLGHNIFSDSSCGQNVAGGDVIIQNLALGALGDNGGLTPTHSLLPGSPGIDAVPLNECSTVGGRPVLSDQRGAVRPAGSYCDIGAVEFNGRLDGLVSYWPADGNTNDVVGPNNGSLQNGQAYQMGIVGQAFSLDGQATYVTAADSPSLSLTGPLTLEAWIRLSDNTRQQAIIEKYDVPALNGYFLRVTDAGKVQSSVCDTTTCSQPPATGVTTVSAGVWHHVAGVYDGTTIKVYLDGVLEGTSNTTFTPTDGTATLKIGARGDDANTRLGGLIDEVRIYNRALTAAEISTSANRDSTPPSILPIVTGTLGSNGWYTSNITVSWNVTEGESDVTSSSGCDNASVTSDTSGVTFTCSAASGGGTASNSVTVKRDATGPSVNVAAPTGTYLLGQGVSASYTCSDGLSGIASCSGTVGNGDTIDTSTAGPRPFSATATDAAGNTTTSTVIYAVGYGVQVLYDQSKSHKSGSTVPVKIRLVDAAGNNVSSAGVAVHAASVLQVSSEASTTLDDSGNSNPDFDFRYDAELAGYIFNLKTTGYSTGTYLLHFTAGASAASYSAGFQVRQ